MVKENGMVMMTETEFKVYAENAQHNNELIHEMQMELKELKEALLVATRDRKKKLKGIGLKRQTFLDVYDHCFLRENGSEDDIYGHDVYVYWHGFFCNCSDGATAYNNIIEGIKGCIDEDDSDDY